MPPTDTDQLANASAPNHVLRQFVSALPCCVWPRMRTATTEVGRDTLFSRMEAAFRSTYELHAPTDAALHKQQTCTDPLAECVAKRQVGG